MGNKPEGAEVHQRKQILDPECHAVCAKRKASQIPSIHLTLQAGKLNSKERKSLTEVVDKSYLCSLNVNLGLKTHI